MPNPILTAFLTEAHHSHTSAAEALGVSPSCISAWVNNRREVPKYALLTIEALLAEQRRGNGSATLILTVPAKHTEALCRIIHSFDGKYIKAPQL